MHIKYSIPRLVLVLLCLALPSHAEETPRHQPTDAPVTLVLGIDEHPYTTSLLPLLPEFEKATGIKVTVDIFSPEEQWLAARDADVSSGTGHFDVLMLDQVLTQYARAGWIEPLDAYLDNPALVDLANYDLTDIPYDLRQYGTVDGHVYGIPIDADAEILYYRQDLFERHGLRAPTTMDELYLTALELDRPGEVAGICMRGRAFFAVMNYTGLLWSYGGQHFDDILNPRRAMFNRPPGVAALTRLGHLLQDAGPQGVGDYSWEECTRDFRQGKVAMYIDSSLVMSMFEDRDNSSVHGRVGYAPLPKGPQGSIPNSFNWMMGINAASRNKEAAFRFIVWASGKDISLRTAIKNGSSARESVWRSPEFLAAFPHPSWADVTITSMKNAGPDAPFPRITQISDFLTNVGGAIHRVITGQTDPQNALDHAAANLDARLSPDAAPAPPPTPPPQQSADISGFRAHTLFTRFDDPAAPSQRTINAIIQDRQGFMWFGTDDGLYKYDGIRFTRYRQEAGDPAGGVAYNFISALCEDHHGNLWVANWGGGLSRFDPITQTFTHYPGRHGDQTDSSPKQVRSLLVDHAGILWIGSFDQGLDAFDPGTARFTHYGHSERPTGLIQNVIWSITEDRDGALWIGTTNGLDRLDAPRREFAHYRNDPGDAASLSNDTVMALCQDKSGTLWVGTRNGLNRLDRASGRFVRYRHDPARPDSLINNVVMSCYEDQAGTLWIGTEGGLAAFDAGANRFTHHTHDPDDPHSLVDDRVRTVFQDRSGLLWVGTYRGISALRTPPKFAIYRDDRNTLDSNHIRALLADSDGALWIGTNDGLARYDRPGRTTRFWVHDPRDPNSIDAGMGINVIDRDRQGRVWLGGWGTGLQRLDPATGQFTHYRHQDATASSLSHDTIFAIHQDRRGLLWIGTAGGLNRFDPATGEFRAFHHHPDRPGGLAGPDVRVIFEDNGGILWLGSRFHGITRFDPDREQFQVYAHDRARTDSIASNSITSILQDRTGRLWFGTAAGLSRFDERTATFDNDRLGAQVLTERVHCLLDDGHGQFWISTDHGLVHYSPESGALSHYTSVDGLQDRRFNDGACARDPNGDMFFGGADGINGFQPSAVRKDTFAPPVILTDLRIMGQSVASDPDAVVQKPVWQLDRIVLPFDKNTVALEFTAMDYANPDRNRYRYRLEGYEADWHGSDNTARNAEYVNLRPGDYVFRAQGTNHDGVWSPNSLSLAIHLTPPWWDTWLFRGAILAGFAALLAGAYRWRTQAMSSRARRLETLVHERTGELRESERALSTLMGNLPGMAYRRQPDRSCTMAFVSDGCTALTGYAPNALVQNAELAYGGLIHPEDRESVWTRVLERTQAQRPYQLTYRITTRTGDLKWVWEQGRGDFDARGRLVALEGLIIDISRRKQAEEALRASEQRLQAVIANNIDGMIVVDRDGAVRFINPAAAALLGRSPVALEGQSLGLPITRTDGVATEIELARDAGHTYPAELRVTTIQWMNRPAYLVTLRDITERKQLERELEQQATTDELTGLCNRRHFLQLAHHELQRARRSRQPTAIAVMDLDHFKEINDTYGHAVGDEALRHLARIIKNNLRQSDVFARIGGDEFVLLLPETDGAGAYAVLDRARQALAAQPIDLKGTPIAVTISVGITNTIDASDTVDTLLARADHALYRAKQAGRNRAEQA